MSNCFDNKLAASIISYINDEGVFNMTNTLARRFCKQVGVKKFYDEDTYKQVIVKFHDDSE